MGNGIAQVCAQAGIQVFMNDIGLEILDRALKNISWSVGKFIEKGKLKESLETIMARISVVT
jgi:3-hydroxybutyryl-CoA dehydrogenase